MLEKIKLITGSSKDGVLGLYIELAQHEFTQITKRAYSDEYEYLIVMMVVEKYNKRYNEGITSTAIGTGLTASFLDGYSQEVKDQLKAIKRNVGIF